MDLDYALSLGGINGTRSLGGWQSRDYRDGAKLSGITRTSEMEDEDNQSSCLFLGGQGFVAFFLLVFLKSFLCGN